MRLRIVHEIAASFEPAVPLAIREIRMSPRTYDGQYVGDWRIDVDHDCRLDRVLDAYGNLLHDFSVAGPLKDLTVTAAGEVEVDDTAGVLPAATFERLPPRLFLRETPLTQPSAALRALAAEAEAAESNLLDRCHALLHLLHDRLEAEDPAEADLVGTCEEPAATALERGAAGPATAAHIFITAARVLGVPARFVSGYLWRGDDRDRDRAAHAWAEAFVQGLGWVGFDVIEDRCPTDAYVRVAACLDQHGAAWIRGMPPGNGVVHVTCRAAITRVEL